MRRCLSEGVVVATLQETSSLQSGVSLRSFSRMDPVQEFNLEAGMGLLVHACQA